MDIKKSSCLAESALRIYLTCFLHQTEQLIKDYNLRLSVCSSSAQRSLWENVLGAAKRVLIYIKQQDEDTSSRFFVRGLHRLCAIEAAQDALVSSLANAHTNHNEHTPKKHFEYQFEEHTFRAKCLMNAVVCLDRQHADIAELWEQAAQVVWRQCLLRRADSRGKKWSAEGIPELAHLTKASALLTPNSSTNTLEVSLKAQAARCYSLCAVHAVLGRQTNYRFAATYYETAASFCQKADKSHPCTAKLWSTAVSTLRLAAEMIVAQAVNNTAGRDTLVQETIQLAHRFAEDADKVAAHLEERETLLKQHSRTLALIARNKVPSAIPGWRLLAALQDELQHLWERFVAMVLDCEGHSDAAEELLRQFNLHKDYLQPYLMSTLDLERHIDAMGYYQQQASQSHTIPYPALRDLAVQCWRRAAEHTEEAVQLGVLLVEEGELRSQAHVILARKQWLVLKARMYVYCATGIVHQAVQYSNAAAGASGALRDPREAEWWQAAVSCFQQAAGLYVTQIDTGTAETEHVYGDAGYVHSLQGDAMDNLHDGENLATAAGHLDLSFKFRTQPELMHFASRVSELYVLVAETVFKASEYEGSSYFVVNRARKFCLEHIDKLTGVKKIHSEEEMKMGDQGCKYLHRYLAATGEAPTRKWKLTLEACLDGAKWWVSGWNEQSAMVAAVCALYARSAEICTTDAHESLRYHTAAGMVAEALEQRQESKSANYAGSEQQATRRVSQSVTHYRVELAHRVCALSTAPDAVPEELQSLLKYYQSDFDPRVETLLCMHVDACAVEIECNCEWALVERVSPESNAWFTAEREARYLQQNLLSQVKNMFDERVQEEKHFADLIALRKVSLRCYLLAARDTGKAELWSAAVAFCEEAVGPRIQTVNNTKRSAVTVISMFTWAAQAASASDTELADLWSKAAVAARKMYLQSAPSRPPEHDLRAAILRAHALTARREGKEELAEVRTQLAELIVEEYSASKDTKLGPNTTAKRTKQLALKSQIDKLLAQETALEAGQVPPVQDPEADVVVTHDTPVPPRSPVPPGSASAKPKSSTPSPRRLSASKSTPTATPSPSTSSGVRTPVLKPTTSVRTTTGVKRAVNELSPAPARSTVATKTSTARAKQTYSLF